jgi:hypothetical protein
MIDSQLEEPLLLVKDSALNNNVLDLEPQILDCFVCLNAAAWGRRRRRSSGSSDDDGKGRGKERGKSHSLFVVRIKAQYE